jgi:hypothetical protein
MTLFPQNYSIEKINRTLTVDNDQWMRYCAPRNSLTSDTIDVVRASHEAEETV